MDPKKRINVKAGLKVNIVLKADSILDWDNKKANHSLVKRIMSATNQENEIKIKP